MSRVAALAGLVGLAGVALVALAGSALAHPLGNFTANTSAAIVVRPEAVVVDYVVDLAEIPALRVVQDLDADGDGAVSEPEGAGYRMEECGRLAGGIDLAIDGAMVDLAVVSTALELPPGQGGLATLRLECRLEAPSTATGDRTITFDDANLDGRIGWREVTAVGDGTTLTSSDVPAASTSDRLRDYPEDQLASPLSIRSAALAVTDGADGGSGAAGLVDAVGPGGAAGGALDRATDAFTGLVARPDLTIATALAAVLVAVGLGALHGVAPGHGKTVMAAYLVSKEGTARQALGLALTVAVTHTVGVLVLGAVLTAAEVAAPQQLYGWLGLVSGLLFAAVGAGLLRSALARRRSGETHHHHDGHGHHAERQPALAAAAAAGERPGAGDAVHVGATGAAPGSHDHPPGVAATAHEHHPGRAPRPRGGVSWRSLAVPGLAGGMVPTPSALVVLLGGIALDRAWFGVALVGAYGVGMAGVLVAAGMLLLRARGSLESRVRTGRLGRLAAVLPLVTACLVLTAGLVIAARAASTI